MSAISTGWVIGAKWLVVRAVHIERVGGDQGVDFAYHAALDDWRYDVTFVVRM